MQPTEISRQLYQHHQEHRYVRYRDRLGEMLCFFLIFRATLFCHLFLIPTELNDNCLGLARHIIVPPTNAPQTSDYRLLAIRMKERVSPGC
jgi:hypothetical protein